MTKCISVGALVQNGLLEKGVRVDYIPDNASYKAKVENTGYYDEQIFHNDRSVNWSVVYVDKVTGEAFIMPDQNLIEDFCLKGIIGYMNGPNELNCICEALGSNAKLGLKARCVNVDDMNKITGYIPEAYDNLTRYAYFPKGSIVRGNIIYDSRSYVETLHRGGDIRFYESDAGGRVEKDENDFSYRVPRVDNPVLITESYYNYNAWETFHNSGCFWLASTCVGLGSYYAGFCMRYVRDYNVNAELLCYSYGHLYSACHGIRPIVCLSSKLQMCRDNVWRFASR